MELTFGGEVLSVLAHHTGLWEVSPLFSDVAGSLSRSFIGSEPACLMLKFHLGKSVGDGPVLLVATAKNNKRGL
jgi:hypothetical protein